MEKTKETIKRLSVNVLCKSVDNLFSEQWTMLPRLHTETNENQHHRTAQHIGSPRRGEKWNKIKKP